MVFTTYDSDLYFHFPYNKKSDKVIVVLTHQATSEDTIMHLDDYAPNSIYMKLSFRYMNLKDGVYTMKIFNVISFDEFIDREPDILMKTFEVRINVINDTEYNLNEDEKEFELIHLADSEYNLLTDENKNDLID